MAKTKRTISSTGKYNPRTSSFSKSSSKPSSSSSAANRGIGPSKSLTTVRSGGDTSKRTISTTGKYNPKTQSFANAPKTTSLETKVNEAVQIADPGISQKDYQAGITGQLNSDVGQFQKTSDEYGFDVKFNDKVTETQNDLDFNEAQYQNQLENMKWATQEDKKLLMDQKKRAANVLGATKSMYAQGREGAQSSTNAKLASELEMKQQNELNYLQTALEHKMRDRGAAAAALENAKQKNDERAVALLSGQLAQAEQDLLTVQSMATQVAQNNLSFAQNAAQAEAQKMESSINNYTSFLTQGYQGTLENAIQIGQDFGLSVEQSMNLYNGYKDIMGNNKLTVEQKNAEARRLTQDAKLQQQGYITEQQQSAKMFSDAFQSGAITEEQMGELFRVAGIDSKFNPAVQIQDQLSMAQLAIEQRKINGQPVGFSEYQALADGLAAQNAFYGTGGEAFVPTESLEGISMEWDGGKMNFTLPTDENGNYKPFQCGEFVNRAWGLGSGGSGGFGNSLETKMQQVQNNGVSIGQINTNNYTDIIKPGMAFVSSAGGEYGHVGIVTQVMPNGDFLTMEANVIGDTGAGSPPVEQRHNIADADLKGFVKPPNAMSVGAESEVALSNLEKDIKSQVISQGDKFKGEQTVKDFNQLQEKAFSFDEIVNSRGATGPADLALVFDFMKSLDPSSVVRESEYDSAAKSGNVLAGQFKRFNRYLGKGQALPENVKQEFNELVQLKLKNKQVQYDNVRGEYGRVINNIAGVEVADQILVDYSAAFNTPEESTGADSSDPLGLGITQDDYDPLGLF